MELRSLVSDEMINNASREVGLLWPLDSAVAVNPLLDMVDESFEDAVTIAGDRLGVDLWPKQVHLDEAERRGLTLLSTVVPSRVKVHRRPTMFERVNGDNIDDSSAARSIVGQILLEAFTAEHAQDVAYLQRVCQAVSSDSSWVKAPRALRDEIVELLTDVDLNALLGSCTDWSDAEIEEEMARHFARLPGWSSWAKWNDLWARAKHRYGVTRSEFLAVSFAVDLAWLKWTGVPVPPGPDLPPSSTTRAGIEELKLLETAVHGEFLDWLHPRPPFDAVQPRFQIVTCIDVRSEPLRRALEENPHTETFGFAGFFGVFATIQPNGDREEYDSLPVLVPPSSSIEGGPSPTRRNSEVVAASATLAELTHEPTAMFALAEASGFLAAPWLLARSFFPNARVSPSQSPGSWHLSAPDRVKIAEGALRGMGLTQAFAEEVLLLGHASSSANNPHSATLQCGACAGHSGGPNASVLAETLNDPEVRGRLDQLGISIPDSTRFVSGVHDTTREVVVIHNGCSDELVELVKKSTEKVAQWRVGKPLRGVRSARRLLDRRARDWSEVRPEWGLADHAAFVVAPRSSLRGVDLKGRSFLHSYDPDSDVDGSILCSILAAPVVVAQWINAAYYFASVAPDDFGAGDKALHNPVGDFAVVLGEDSDLCVGLPRQSLFIDARPVHLPVRLLVAVEAPLDRITHAVHSSSMPQQLVEGQWIRLVGRSNSLDEWHDWIPGRGFGGNDA